MKKYLLVLLTGWFSLTVAQGAEWTGTLKKIKESGRITLGHRESSIPFSYYDNAQRVVGYSHDFMLRVAQAIQDELALPDLQIRLMPVTSSNRILLVQNGTVDLECGSTTNNPERQKQVAFSNSLFIVTTRLLTRTDSAIGEFSDLAGKNVVTTAGTTSERLLRKLNQEKQLAMNIISTKDHGESFLTLETGRAVAFMMDDALLYGEMAKAKRPGEWHVVATAQSREAYGCMMAKDDPPFKALVDKTIARIMTSGEADAIYRTWFLQPIPPKGINLGFPLSESMKALFQSPNDQALE